MHTLVTGHFKGRFFMCHGRSIYFTLISNPNDVPRKYRNLFLRHETNKQVQTTFTRIMKYKNLTKLEYQFQRELHQDLLDHIENKKLSITLETI